MKRTFFALLLIISTAMTTACGDKDETPEDTTKQKLIGKWKHVSIKGIDANGKELSSENQECHYYDFFADGKGNLIDYYNNKALCEETEEFETESPFIWVFNNNSFTFSFVSLPEAKMEYDIVNVTESILEVEYPIFDEDIEDFPENTVKIRWVLTKVQ